MIGVFLVNTAGEICLTRYNAQSEADIKSLIYLPSSKITAVVYTDDSEEVIVQEMTEDTHQALVDNSHALIVHMADDSTPEREYKVPIRK